MNMIRIVKLNGSDGEVDLADLDEFRGDIIAPDDEGYYQARQIWNVMIDKKPGLILKASGMADVQIAVRFAKRHELLLSVKGGGHNIGGSALCDGGLMIDLSGLNAVRVYPDEMRCSAEGGALLGDIDHETQAFGLAVPTGINSTTGIGGLALGGGFGWLSRKFGHTADNIIGMDVVTANGDIVRASETQNSDLFWALRGGGGNFGIVVNFDFRCHAVDPDFLSGPCIHLLKDAKAVLRAYREVAINLPDEATCWTVFRKAPPFPFLDESYHGKDVLILVMTYAGNAVEGEKALAPLRAIGSPVADGVSIHPFKGWQAAFDPLVAPPARNYWKSHDFDELTDEVIDQMVLAAGNFPSDECEIFTAQLGGFAGRIASDAIAFPHRAHNYTMNIHGRWMDAEDDDTCTEWVRGLFAEVEPFALGSVYVNFVPENNEAREVGPYGANQQRLAKIKHKYDPKNRFRTNINIVPSET